jgi:hypothetical protein
MTRPRVRQHKVGQITDQHTDGSRSAIHPGSVSHLVYSADGAV